MKTQIAAGLIAMSMATCAVARPRAATREPMALPLDAELVPPTMSDLPKTEDLQRE